MPPVLRLVPQPFLSFQLQLFLPFSPLSALPCHSLDWSLPRTCREVLGKCTCWLAGIKQRKAPEGIRAFTGGSATCGLKRRDAQGLERAASFILCRASSAPPRLQRKRLQVLHHLQTPQTVTLLTLSGTLLTHAGHSAADRIPVSSDRNFLLSLGSSSQLRRGDFSFAAFRSGPQLGYDLLALLLELQQLLPPAILSDTRSLHSHSEPCKGEGETMFSSLVF